MEVQKNQSNHSRGLHIVIINPSKGTVENALVFDTYKDSKKLEEFFEKGITKTDPHIVVIAC